MNIPSSHGSCRNQTSTTLRARMRAYAENPEQSQGHPYGDSMTRSEAREATWDMVSLLSRVERESSGEPLNVSDLMQNLSERRVQSEEKARLAIDEQPTLGKIAKEHATGFAMGFGGTFAAASPLFLYAAVKGYSAIPLVAVTGFLGLMTGFQGAMALADGSWADRREAGKDARFELQQSKAYEFAEKAIPAWAEMAC